MAKPDLVGEAIEGDDLVKAHTDDHLAGGAVAAAELVGATRSFRLSQ
jgi:hypothetical protein